MKIHSGERTAREIQLVLDQSSASNIRCISLTMSSPKVTTAVIHYITTRHRVRCAMWEVVQQSLWFQQERSVRTAGPWSMEDIWSQKCKIMHANAAATFVWTRHRKLQLVQKVKTNHFSTLLKSIVEHFHVQCTMMAGNWPASFALSNEYLDNGQLFIHPCIANSAIFISQCNACV